MTLAQVVGGTMLASGSAAGVWGAYKLHKDGALSTTPVAVVTTGAIATTVGLVLLIFGGDSQPPRRIVG